MRLGMVGLGRMGANMATRLIRDDHEVVAYDVDPAAVENVGGAGATGADSLAGLVALLEAPRTVWVMVPAGAVTDAVLDELLGLLEPGDRVADGGNSRWTATLQHAAAFSSAGVDFVDVGTSGGVWGLEAGYCLMVGGEEHAVSALRPLFETLAPADGWAHVGGSGAGHFTKMVHNGVEYALMQAYAEGFELLQSSDLDLDVAQIAEVWRHGSVVRSWLLDLAAAALREDPGLSRVRGYVEDSGEGRWTVAAAVDAGVPTPTIAQALFTRFASRHDDGFGNRLLAALRQQFGGHAVRPPSSD